MMIIKRDICWIFVKCDCCRVVSGAVRCCVVFQPYKFVLSCRLLDVGQYERALAYTEVCARAVTRAPELYSAALVARLAELADRYTDT